MSKPQSFPGKQVTHQSALVVPLAFGFAALVVLALWLHDPAVAQLVLLAAALPAILVLAYGVLRILAASEPRGWRWPGRYRQWRDTRSGLLAGPALAELGDRLLKRSQRRGEPLAVLVFDFDDRDQVKDLYSVRARHQMLDLIGRKLRRLAGRKGLALRPTPGRFVVLLPGCTRALALELATDKFGVPCSFELDSAEDELVLLPRVTALCATDETESVERLLRDVQAQRVPRPGVGRPPPNTSFSSGALQLPEARPVAKPQFDLPDAAGLSKYSAFPSTFPMPLASATARNP